MHFTKITIASLLALAASVSASPVDGTFAGGFPVGGYENPAPVSTNAAPVANAAAPAASGAAAAPAPAAAATSAAAGVPAVGTPAPVAGTPAVGTPAPAVGTPAPAAGAVPLTGKVFTVMVGNGNLTYIPRNFQAAPGDVVNFVWTVGNHTVTQSTKDNLCSKKAGDSFVSGNHGPPFSWNLTINSTDPLWYYCGVPNHCQKGMYAAINFPDNLAFPTPGNGTSGNSTAGNGTSTDAPKMNGAASLSAMSSSVLLAGTIALGAFLL